MTGSRFILLRLLTAGAVFADSALQAVHPKPKQIELGCGGESTPLA
jgi:hypothetical protein